MQSNVALIPARAGSKGVPNKNIRMLGGYPLIGWSIPACKLAGSINRTIVSTDSKKYAQISRGLGAEVPLKRFGMPDESGELVAYLLSDAATFMTGSIVTVDGGQSL